MALRPDARFAARLYSGEQLQNAAHIMAAGAALGLDARGQTIGVMTAMGESSLRVLDQGDAVGPDSRGLFQQRDNGRWGSYEDRMYPFISATNFFKALQQVQGWENLPPSIAAHRVQVNADPYHYERYVQPAAEVVAGLSGVDPGEIQECTVPPENSAVDIPTGRWFTRGVLVSLTNPKVMLFFLAVLPQFLGAAQNVTAQLAVLGAVNVAAEVLLYGGIGLVAGALHARFAGSHRATSMLHYLAAGVYLLLAAAVIVETFASTGA